MTWTLLLGAAPGLLAGALNVLAVRRTPADEPLRPLWPIRQPGERWTRLDGAVLAATVAAAVLMAQWCGPGWTLPAVLHATALAVALTVIDIRHHRLPDALVLPSYPIAAGLLALAALGEGAWSSFGRALAGGAAMFTGYVLLALVQPAGLGGGDIKLAGLLGLYLGWAGWHAVIVGAVLAFVLGALAGVVVIARRGSIRAAIPFGPFMLLGALAAVLWGAPIAAWYTGMQVA